MSIANHLSVYNTSVAYFDAIVKDIDLEKLPKEKRNFYETLEAFIYASNAIINAKQDEVNHLKRAQLTTITEREKYFSETWAKFTQMYEAKGGDISLIKYW